MPRETPDPVEVWSVFGRHAAALYGGGTGFRDQGPGWFAVLTGEPNADLNLAGLFGPAGGEHVSRLLDAGDAVGGPLTMIESPTLGIQPGPRLRSRGLLRIDQTEALMWHRNADLPVVAPAPFRVDRARTSADLAAAAGVLHAAHGIAPEQMSRVFDLRAFEDGRLGCWIAWDGEEAACIGWLTFDGPLVGVWEMMTAPDHRRRGAARAVLSTAMAEAAGDATDGFFLWASPMGRPLYASLGFAVIDEVTVWVRGVDPADLEKIGVIPPG